MISSWDDLRYLEAFERLGTAGAAGRELGVAASTIYRRVAALEQSVGFPCLVRGRGITPAGRELAQLARTTGNSLQSIAQRASEQRDEVRGPVVFATLDGLEPLLSAPFAELSILHPQLRVDVHITAACPSQRDPPADLALTLLRKPPPTYVGRKLLTIRFGVYGTRALASDPERARWVVLGEPLDKSWIGRWEREHVPREQVAAVTTSRRMFLDLVTAGAGVGLLPEALAENHPELVELTSYRERSADLERPAWLLVPPELRNDVRITTVVKVLSKHLRRSSGPDVSSAQEMQDCDSESQSCDVRSVAS
ncbi:LysR family transcriptional regulator [Chondromyces crocatus]|uniref:HTH lysR-type domain-containing protein n=1 Tax=Chondromyces crocatus TaxID=52 RepID=A0A0K1E7A9_CHOCO|nr:LysR family transcriptional regulator [Chondromyces crocatus]AKT36463.1 uncharacterized protein CMC5_005780 [Chondromyces crocatus]